MYKTLKTTYLRFVLISNISALVFKYIYICTAPLPVALLSSTSSVMTDRLSNQSGASLREPLLVVSIRSEQTIHTNPCTHHPFFLFHNFPSVHLFTAAFSKTSQLPVSAIIAETVDLNM